MPRLAVLLSHELTSAQKEDASVELGCEEFIFPPHNISSLWRSVPEEIPHISEFTLPIVKWLSESTEEGDYVFVAGDFGMTFFIVDWSLKNARVPLYSTSKRNYTYNHDRESGEIVNVHRFIHSMYRRYMPWESSGTG